MLYILSFFFINTSSSCTIHVPSEFPLGLGRTFLRASVAGNESLETRIIFSGKKLIRVDWVPTFVLLFCFAVAVRQTAVRNLARVRCVDRGLRFLDREPERTRDGVLA